MISKELEICNRYITNDISRYSTFADNCCDCLKILNICSLQSIKKFNSKEKIEFPLKDDEESNLIRSFFSKWELFKFG